MATRTVRNRSIARIAALSLAAGMTFAGFGNTAHAQDLLSVDSITQTVTDAIGEVTGTGSSSATHSWKNSNVTRSVEVNGVAGAVVKPGDVVTFTLTYTDNNIWGAKSYIQRMTDVIPDGLQYVANSATYKVGDDEWANQNESDKWLEIVNNGAVEFAADRITQAWGSPTTSTVSFKWKYRVTDAIADGALNTGTEIHFNPSNSVEKLHDMGPKLTVKREAPAPDIPGIPDVPGGSLGSPSLQSPSLPSPGFQSPGLPSPGINR
ncbi:hypothetical protein HMPREF2857_03190 [Corynebacterium sp. HMSC076C10]|uniref:hypothetical protein n=1 Tax=Corynebacterium sp. HMSC076C10 TaxID=1739361 RepID=UPI0008A2704A|nr:hypothetical protein [Corynebacterium sp. HMSC076C10]OFJ56892.1 hypothetical protein HMPREF2857_03190 [Corynebacterium sp. HMSC076C10]